jgi:hypothetical protein
MFRHAHDLKPRPAWRLPLTLLPAAAVTLLPKCPLCLMGIMSALGLGTLIGVGWLKPLTLVMLGAAVGSLALRARRSRGYNPLLLGLLAAVMVFVSKFYLDYPLAAYGGLVLLFAATLWGAWAGGRATPQGGDCGC